MVNTKSKSVALILYFFTSLISWLILLSSLFIQLATLFQENIVGIDTLGFAFTTILITGYTVVIFFKFRGVAYFPLVIALFHLLSLQNSVLLPLYLIVDLVVLVLLNTTQPLTNEFREEYTFDQKQRVPSGDDIIDAEYTEH